MAPWAVSGAIHAGLIGLGFTVAWTVVAPGGEREKERIIVHFDDPGPAARGESGGESEAAAEAVVGGAEAAPLPRAALPPAIEAEALGEPLADLRSAPRAPVNATQARSAEERTLAQARRLPDVRFAGVGASNARGVVFVVDASGSTVSTFPMIRGELRRSLEKLAPTQRFQVLFFGPGRDGVLAAEHPADREAVVGGGRGGRTIRLIRATRVNVEGVLGWIDSVRPGRRSNPIPALELALGLRPDAVFVLSTAITGLGMWEPDKATLLAQLEALNPVEKSSGRRGVVIKTIQMMEDDPAGILRAIGEAHGGRDGYKFLSRREVMGP